MKADKRYCNKRRIRARVRGAVRARKGGLDISDLRLDYPHPLDCPALLKRLEGEARFAFEAHCNAKGARLPSRRHPMPGLLNQRYAAEERRWRSEAAEKAHGDVRRSLRRTGQRVWRLAVTLQNADWVVETAEMTPQFFAKLRKRVARAAKRIAAPNLVTGFVDVSYNVDKVIGLARWGVHVHLTVTITARSPESAKRRVRRAFPYRKALAMGIRRPVVQRRCYDQSGWEKYIDKGLNIDGVRQRVTRRDRDTGEILESGKPHLTQRLRAEWAGVLAQLKGNDLMIWVGYRRYGSRLQAFDVTDQDQRRHR